MGIPCSEYFGIDFTNVNKFVHNGNEYALIFKTRKRFSYDTEIFDAMDMVSTVRFSYDIMPYRKSAEDGVKVGATGVVANLQNHSENDRSGETFGNFFRFLASYPMDKLD